MKKKLALVIGFPLLVAAVVCSVFGGYYLWSTTLPNVYENTYYAALVDKFDYLKSKADKKKIILVGGSNVAFGFNSEMLEKEFPEYEVVNFGLYAGLGTKIMMDLALPFVGEGDMVFLIPETNSQSMSLYFSPVSTWKAIETERGIYNYLPSDNQSSMQGNYFNYIKEKKEFSEPIPGSGIYQRKNFNDHFDFEYLDDEGNSLRSQNTMSQHYDPSMTIDFKSELLNESFAEYANEYNRLVAQKGAKLYFEFSPMNELGVENADLESLSNYYWLLRESFDFPVIGNPEEYVIDPHYFFDSNFHLNDVGAIYRTKIFADDIYRDVFEVSKESSIDFPEKPDYPDIIIGEDSESIKYFDLVENSSGYTLSKVKDEYLSIESIDIPMYFNGKVINTIAQGCFELCSNLSEIIIPLTISGIENGGFSNKFHLDKVVLLQNDPNKIKVDFTGGLVEGVVDGFKFFIPESGRDAYSVDYYWGPYYSYMEFYDDDLAQKWR